jgi:nucleotide-binding universal stress UspA family protein
MEGSKFMFDKILWATDGSLDSKEALIFAEVLAKKYNAGILSLFVTPEYQGVIDNFSTQEKDRFTRWIEDTLRKGEKKKLEDMGRDFKAKGISFSSEIREGIPYKEVLKVASENSVDLIALGKGRAGKRSMLGGTALKVIRQSKIPVLTARQNGRSTDIRRILVPTDQSRGLSGDFKYAVELSTTFGATIFLLNVVEVGEYKFPLEIVEQMKGFCLRELKENIGKVKISKNIEACVDAAKNAWSGIVKFVNDNDIDIIVMMTYGGGKIREQFIGSVTQKVIQESPCPVITLTPHA